jgi:photosystem II stability/assembly factor-like uncharacterized protein
MNKPGGADRGANSSARIVVAALVLTAALIALAVGILIARHPARPTASAPSTGDHSSAGSATQGATAGGSAHPASSAPSTPPGASTQPGGSRTVGPAGGPVPAGFHAVDLSFVDVNHGWALGTAPCAAPPCTSIVRTTDGGHSWVGIPAPRAPLAGSPGSISGLRFADRLRGYAFGIGASYRTVDGGASWQRSTLASIALEARIPTVLEIDGGAPDCSPGCHFRIESSTVGRDDWRPIPLPVSGLPGVGAQLVRSGSLAAALFTANPAGGAQSATSVLLVSSDNGQHWSDRGEVCPQNARGTAKEVDSRQLTAGTDGSLAVLCVPRLSTSPSAVTVLQSRTGTGPFIETPPVYGSGTTEIAALTSKVLFAVSDAVYRSTPGSPGTGAARVISDSSLTGHEAPFLGFETASTGRYLSVDGKALWTTTDTGLTWFRSAFS